MIFAIRGRLSLIQEDRVILEVNGLSYEILVSPFTLGMLASKGDEEVSLKTILYIQGTPGIGNMIPVLVGFMTEAEKGFFEYFITVGGIGPRAALKALTMPAEHIARAIEDGNNSVLTTLPGIGKQRAAKIIAELKGKLGKFAIASDQKDADVETYMDATGEDNILEEAIEVLIQLGYRRQESEDMVRRATGKYDGIMTVEGIIQEVFRLSTKQT
ncbi:MAG: hypothetical protein GX969_08015 [Firmicutes bacterium]|jgi:Holliday junction DNA helicase RuvA|nr:hypothetical protein [Bacillota bacterium]